MDGRRSGTSLLKPCSHLLNACGRVPVVFSHVLATGSAPRLFPPDVRRHAVGLNQLVAKSTVSEAASKGEGHWQRATPCCARSRNESYRRVLAWHRKAKTPRKRGLDQCFELRSRWQQYRAPKCRPANIFANSRRPVPRTLPPYGAASKLSRTPYGRFLRTCTRQTENPRTAFGTSPSECQLRRQADAEHRSVCAGSCAALSRAPLRTGRPHPCKGSHASATMEPRLHLHQHRL
jgi:hypothetical protein